MGNPQPLVLGYMIGWLPLLISKQCSIQCGKVLTLVFRYIKAFHDDGRRCLTENEQPTFSISFSAQSIERKRGLMHNTFFRTSYRRLKIEWKVSCQLWGSYQESIWLLDTHHGPLKKDKCWWNIWGAPWPESWLSTAYIFFKSLFVFRKICLK